MSPGVLRRFIFVVLLIEFALGVELALGASGKGPAFDVRETTIAETQAAIRAGKVTCRELVEAYIKRVKAYDQTTHLNSMILYLIRRRWRMRIGWTLSFQENAHA